jgi:hypothetical protein
MQLARVPYAHSLAVEFLSGGVFNAPAMVGQQLPDEEHTN